MRRIALAFFGVITCTLLPAQYSFVKQWDYRYGGVNHNYVNSVFQTSNSGYILIGGATLDNTGNQTAISKGSRDIWMVKIDSVGNMKWDNSYGTNAYEAAVGALTKNDGYILASPSSGGINGDKSEPSRGGDDYWIVKTDAEGNKIFDRCFGGTNSDYVTCIQETQDGGYLIGGSTTSGIGGDKTQENWDVSQFYDDYWVVKVDSAGNKQWDRRFGGLLQDGLTSIVVCNDGGYILVGSSNSNMDGDRTVPRNGGGDIWIVKIDSAGNKMWDRAYGGTCGETPREIINTNDGGYLIGGESCSGIGGDKTQANKGSWDYWIVKIDSMGNILWDKDFGGSLTENLNSITTTSDGGFLISGRSDSPNGGDKTEMNPFTMFGEMHVQTWVIKTDSAGNKQWDKTILTAEIQTPKEFNSGNAIQTNDGCYLLGATTNAQIGGYKTQANWDTSGYYYDIWVMKFCMEPYNSIMPVEAGESFGLSVYPTPFATDVAISVQKENLREATFTITNSLGQIIYQRAENNLSQGYTKMLDLRYLPKGLYFITVEADGERVVRRVVKE
ncbi:MAG: T9SS type A sorting domain-containing protein [Chitinophagales bacterium]